MKTRFSTIDIIAIVNELQKCIGMRVNQVYDVDNKTYLFKLNRYEEKITLILESGIRVHTTEFDWPKNSSPSGFSMKMRKHLKNKRLEKLAQLGIDRILDLQFGINEAAYHVILELYDRGNIVLTDCEYIILNILRPRATGSEDVKFVVRERYPIEKARQKEDNFSRDELYSALNAAKDDDNLKKILMPHIVFGPALLDHVLLKNGFPKNCCIGKNFKVPGDIHRLFLCLEEADNIMKNILSDPCNGFVIHKVEKNNQNISNEIITNIEFHPFLFCQYESLKHTQYPSFDKAVDNYFSNMEGQKIDLKAFQKEKEALKKLDNVKKDHEHRLSKLHESQSEDMRKAQLIEMNLDLVEKAIFIIRSAIANQISWSDIQDLIKEAQIEGDPVAKAIKKLKLDINHFSLLLNDHIESEDEKEKKPQLVDIDLDYSAYANARKYYDLKRAHAKKEQKTLESSEKAFKNAEKKTRQALKEVAVTTSITKARKIMWFEKFLWFISSENYLIIAGRDIQQNEMIVKKYMKAGDIYVHADLHGASSLVIKNPSGAEIPPKTLNETGSMAVCNSSAWDAKVVTSAWWVYHHQVSKTAPSGEYLTTGSFMIRGKKNYLPPAHLIMGFGFLFKLDEDSLVNHVNERCVKCDESISEVNEETLSEMNEETLSEMNEDTKSDGEQSEDNSDAKSDDSSLCDESGAVSEKQDIALIDESFSHDNKTACKLEDENITSVNFPDTEVKLEVLSESRGIHKTDTKSQTKDNANTVIIQQSRKKATEQSIPLKINSTDSSKEKHNCQKRGQKGKMKRIKEKYKYQDEEERQLRMQILASAGQAKEEKKNKNKKGKDVKSHINRIKNPTKFLHFIEISDESTILEVKNSTPEEKKSNLSVPSESSKEVIQEPEVSDDDNEEIDDGIRLTEEKKLMNSLTGLPLPDDTLLFAVPVCAPYTSMQNYKYKVKIIPGSSKRGKAAKTSLQIFLHEKAATTREKDLLRSVKDQDISRNLPGKCKISSANLKKIK